MPVLSQPTRRNFLKATLMASGAAFLGTVSSRGKQERAKSEKALPWFKRTLRWGQTNITEKDPERYDIEWWRRYWKRTQTQGLIVNAGGIVAYYPTRVPLHQQAQFLNGRDLFGELCKAAHEDGLVVLARMDSNRAHQLLYQAHPDWFAVDRDGKPHRAGELYVACVNSPYYTEHIPAILREIVECYRPEGFADNSWSGLGRSSPCFCEHCSRSFGEKTGQKIPREKNWDDAVYRQWIEWNYKRRLEIWDENNRTTTAAGGPDCLWIGMNSGSISGQCQSFRDYRQICHRASLILLDHQARSDAAGFQQNADCGALIHGLLGWDKLVAESMALYQAGRPTFRLASKPEAEARLWMVEGFSGGIQPWWHHVGAYHEDRRMYRTAEPLYRWHSANQEFLVNRNPVATVGVVWSQRNYDFYGRDDAELMVEQPWRGMVQALIRARIPYVPVNVDDLEKETDRFSTLVLPNLAAMSDNQIVKVRNFVAGGGGLVATGQTSLFTESGDARSDFGLADLFGGHLVTPPSASVNISSRKQASETAHSYLRLSPELRAEVDGPHAKLEPPVNSKRHPVLSGFEETDLIPFGGALEPLQVQSGTEIPLSFVPSFPIYPPETAWMREPRTSIPGLLISTTRAGGRVVFLPADLDRRFCRDNLPDHGDLLRNLVRWAAKDPLPLVVDGPGLIDCRLYHQPGRLILHIINLNNAGAWRQPADELVSTGPFRVRVKLYPDVRGRKLQLLVSPRTPPFRRVDGWCHFEIPTLLDHEVAVVS